ncbi:antigen 5 like allergen Cul n 1-like [Ochlerotatus camptorhynchus]|uniref:antigen 5 like allergen Cul n 1-like n=1 Tax=Ochlerotatus camptorhynchus TaxID=644619 RepID=UPI0031E427B0
MKFLFIVTTSTATIFSLASIGALGQTTNFCDPALCPSGGPHIACNGLSGPSASCGAGSFEVTMDSTKQALITNQHNHLRSRVALGNQNYVTNAFYPPAARMATLEWDNELAHIAATNARRCVFAHDRCRNTATMRAVGQNIAIKMFYGQDISDEVLIQGFIDSWFSEYADSNPSHIASYPANHQGPAIGHFTQIVSDRSSRIGCAMVSYIQAPWINKLFVCNYGLTNIISQPVYVAGPTGSQCQTGTSVHFSGLCSTSEVVSNNP